MSNIAERILVTGGCGFIGSHVVEALLENRCRVLAIDNLRTGSLSNLADVAGNSDLMIEDVDVADATRMGKLVASFRPDAIIHLAALVSVQESIENPAENFSLNVSNTQTLLELARTNGVKKFVFASSAAIYGNPLQVPITEDHPKDPLSPYGMGKYVSEQLLEQYRLHYGMETRALRFFNVYGPRQDPSSPYTGVVSIFSDRILRNQKLQVFGDGMQTRDFIFVKDVAETVLRAAVQPGLKSGSYNVSTKIGSTLNELIDVLARITGIDSEVEFLERREGDILESVGCNAALMRIFKIDQFTNIETGLRSLLNSIDEASPC